MWRDLGQPNSRFDRLNLTKERTDAAKFVVPPMLKQARCFWRYTPVIRDWQTPPLVNLVANCIDNGRMVILLAWPLKAPSPHQTPVQSDFASALLRLWDWGDEFRADDGVQRSFVSADLDHQAPNGAPDSHKANSESDDRKRDCRHSCARVDLYAPQKITSDHFSKDPCDFNEDCESPLKHLYNCR